jgi:hypothetical protein
LGIDSKNRCERGRLLCCITLDSALGSYNSTSYIPQQHHTTPHCFYPTQPHHGHPRHTVRFRTLVNSPNFNWTHTRAIPINFVAPTHTLPNTAYRDQFLESMHSILPQDQVECDAKTGAKCISCTQPAGSTESTMLHPRAYLHLANDLFLTVMLQPTCGTKECRSEAQAIIKEDMRDVAEFNNIGRDIVSGLPTSNGEASWSREGESSLGLLHSQRTGDF